MRLQIFIVLKEIDIQYNLFCNETIQSRLAQRRIEMRVFFKTILLMSVLMVITGSAWAKTMTGRFTNPSRFGDYIEYRLPNGAWLQIQSAYGLFKIEVPDNVIVTVRIHNWIDDTKACLRATATWQTRDLGTYHR